MQSMRVQEKNDSDGFNFQRNQDQLYKFPKQTSLKTHMMHTNQKFQLDSTSTHMASCDYSLKEQCSLHSQFFSIKIQDMQQGKNTFVQNESSLQEQSSFFKSNFKRNESTSDENILLPKNNQQQPQKQNTNQSHENEPHKLKKFHNQTKDSIKQKEIQKDSLNNPRKSYTSSLHEIVDRNHLESPSHKLMMQSQDIAQFQNFKLEHEQKNFKKNQVQCSIKIGKIIQVNEIQQKNQNKIHPVVIQQKSDTQKKQSQNSSNKSPKQKSKNNRVQIRRIPSNLYESYDELVLSVNGNDKHLKKHPLDSPIKLKKKSYDLKQSSKDSNENDESKTHDNNKERKVRKNKKDEQLLVNLRVVEGKCMIEGQNGKDTETKFVINKNEIVFHNYKTIFINHITKIKLIHKDEKNLTIKLCYQLSDNKKPESMIIGIINTDDPFYFAKSYQLYSQIILRKLLLMKLSINQVNEKIQSQSYIRSCQSSPTRSPLAHPQSLKIIQVQTKQKEILEAQLYKKAVIFNSWQKKYFTLSSNSLQSFSTPHTNGQKSKPQSNLHKTSEIWTRFELIYGYLVIKLWQNKIQKIQIGIPLCDFTNSQGLNNWLYGLSKQILWGRS